MPRLAQPSSYRGLPNPRRAAAYPTLVVPRLTQPSSCRGLPNPRRTAAYPTLVVPRLTQPSSCRGLSAASMRGLLRSILRHTNLSIIERFTYFRARKYCFLDAADKPRHDEGWANRGTMRVGRAAAGEKLLLRDRLTREALISLLISLMQCICSTKAL